jgi:L-rhamnose mutarotase
MKNFSIFLREPENLLFAYFEYHGEDLAADSARMAADPITQQWWTECNPCQQPFESRKAGEWWASMEPVFFHA